MLQILDMPNLVELYLESNSFTAGDLSGLNNLPNLQFLILHGNPISKIPDSLCDQEQPNIDIYADQETCANSKDDCCDTRRRRDSDNTELTAG